MTAKAWEKMTPEERKAQAEKYQAMVLRKGFKVGAWWRKKFPHMNERPRSR